MRNSKRFKITVASLVLALALLPINEVNAWEWPGRQCTQATLNTAIATLAVFGAVGPWAKM